VILRTIEVLLELNWSGLLLNLRDWGEGLHLNDLGLVPLFLVCVHPT
jgi:hypothetical protein